MKIRQEFSGLKTEMALEAGVVDSIFSGLSLNKKKEIDRVYNALYRLFQNVQINAIDTNVTMLLQCCNNLILLSLLVIFYIYYFFTRSMSLLKF
jgi:hypothetical protein